MHLVVSLSPTPGPGPEWPRLTIDFLVIGESISGIACAVALRRAGHRVTMLAGDRDAIGDSDADSISLGHRLCPNGSKILYDWGHKEELDRICSRSNGILMLDYKNGEHLGNHIWSEEVLNEMRGDWMFIPNNNLWNLLYRSAVLLGVNVLFDTRVASIDPGRCSVTLTTGKTFCADVIIGADGPNGITRTYFPEPSDPESAPGALVMFHTTLSRNVIGHDSDLLQFFRPGDDGILYTYAWLGNGRCSVVYPAAHDEQIVLNMWVPLKDVNGSGHDVPSHETLQAAAGDTDMRLRQIIELGTPPKMMPLTGYGEIEDWVHGSGRMVLLGCTAQPLYHGSLQGTSLSLEDGAVLARLFTHLTSEDQISLFLNGFQDICISRYSAAHASELDYLTFGTLPPGKNRLHRDQTLRQNYAAGRNTLTPNQNDESAAAADQWEKVERMFAYDCTDHADNWWNQWGMLAERAKGVDISVKLAFKPEGHIPTRS